ncbi:tRNA (adenosine(37)-N6)-threonylcarbamoyltransferase complex ATPase subunit type 1 TsaE [Loigolactobacillus zhaoyuanensis]|uniref:tRNA (adenosine(37)-N6)-threonylcarbamoyltransferase complex ATPase subunit type 1 TsaE n=1 Tax=Loigolactobacillus zhaoyuanensis TaxID=2486017 RepID=UPI000F73A350|nr:tRNA (adenosine(37)-N6)-threonylcarbamoyltransferase complex ATPase subunit type 1 TsaE [Loigolactobacillus zhaoyuanensis]
MFQYTVTSDAAMQNVGAKIGQLVEPGSVIFLKGDLGAGKTTFTKGLATALGIQQYVKSPTFTLIREYTSGRIPLYHMDVYRLENGGGDELGLEEYFNGTGVSVVEWPQFIESEWPADYLQITINKIAVDDNQRQLVFKPQGQQYENLVAQLAVAL